jgi:phasin family protein
MNAPAAPAPKAVAEKPVAAPTKTPKIKPVAAKPKPAKKPVAKTPVAKVVVKAAPKPAPAKITPVLKLPKSPKIASRISAPIIKETIMTKTTDTVEAVTTKIKVAFTEVQDKAKAAFEKSSASLTEAGEFAKGNVEALVEAGKLVSTGAQELGKGYVEEAKAGFETLTADVKELAAVKSPTDFFKLQGEIVRRNLDAAVAQSSKNSEAMMKLVNEAFAPLSSRINLAVEKFNKAA